MVELKNGDEGDSRSTLMIEDSSSSRSSVNMTLCCCWLNVEFSLLSINSFQNSSVWRSSWLKRRSLPNSSLAAFSTRPTSKFSSDFNSNWWCCPIGSVFILNTKLLLFPPVEEKSWCCCCCWCCVLLSCLLLSGTMCSGEGVFVSSIESSSKESLERLSSSEKKKAVRGLVKSEKVFLWYVSSYWSQ